MRKMMTTKMVINALLAHLGKENPTPEEALEALRELVRAVPGIWPTLKAWAARGSIPAVPRGTPPGVLAALHRAVEATRAKFYPRRTMKDFRGREIDVPPPGAWDEVPEGIAQSMKALSDLFIEEVREDLGGPSLYEGTKRNLVPESIEETLEAIGVDPIAYDLRELKSLRELVEQFLEQAYPSGEGVDWDDLEAVDLPHPAEIDLQGRVLEALEVLDNGIERLDAGRLVGLEVIDSKTGTVVLR